MMTMQAMQAHPVCTCARADSVPTASAPMLPRLSSRLHTAADNRFTDTAQKPPSCAYALCITYCACPVPTWLLKWSLLLLLVIEIAIKIAHMRHRSAQVA